MLYCFYITKEENMHKKYKEYFESQNATVSGDKAYGVINGYEVNFLGVIPYAEANYGSGGVTLHITFYSMDEGRRAIENEIKILETKFVHYSFDKFGVQFNVTDWTAGKIANKIGEIINKVSEILKNYNALGSEYCPICGMKLPENAVKRQVNGMLIAIDDDCVNKLNEIIDQENREFEAAPNNYLKGFLGALIGGIAGAVIAILLNIVGFYAGISSFVAFFVGVILYKKFGGKPDKIMLVIVTATTFVMMIVAVLSIYIVIAGMAAAEAGRNISAFEAFAICMENTEFSSLFYVDLIMTLLFTVIGCVAEIVKTARQIKRSKNI